MTNPPVHKHEAPERDSAYERFRDAVAPRSVALGVGVLLLQFGFIWSYIGAFHAPTPHQIPMIVVAPSPEAVQVVDSLNALDRRPLAARTEDESAANDALRRGEVAAIWVVHPTGNGDELQVASAAGAAQATAVEDVITKVAAIQGRTVAVRDVVPLQPGDARGLSGFYLVVGWIVGGYLFRSLLGIAKGSRPANLARALWRLGVTVPYAVASGVGGTAIAESLLGAFGGHFWMVSAIGVLATLSAATVTIALQTLFGVIGIGITVIVFVILGNPSAGGAYQSDLLPPFWREISTALPNGAATSALRRIVYFDGNGIAGNATVLAVWIAVAAAGAVLASLLRERRLNQQIAHPPNHARGAVPE